MPAPEPVQQQGQQTTTPIRNSGETLMHKLEKSLHVSEGKQQQQQPNNNTPTSSDSLLAKLARSVHPASPANGHIAPEPEIDRKALSSAIVSVFKTYPRLLQ